MNNKIQEVLLRELMLMFANRVLKRLEDSLIFKYVGNKCVFVLTPPNQVFSSPFFHNQTWKSQINVW